MGSMAQSPKRGNYLEELAVVLLCDDELINVLLPVFGHLRLKKIEGCEKPS